MDSNLMGLGSNPYSVFGGGQPQLGGVDAQTALTQLTKALEAGQITGRDIDGQQIPGQLAPLVPESLEMTVRSLSFKDSDIVLLRNTPRVKAIATVHQFSLDVDYGQEALFSAEGDLPEDTTSTYARESENIKLVSQVRSVTHMATQVNTIGMINALQVEIEKGIRLVMQAINANIAIGNAETNPLSFNGLYAQQFKRGGYGGSIGNYLESEQVIDLRGRSLKVEDFDNAAQIINGNYGQASHSFLPPQAQADFIKDIYERIRYMPGVGGTKGARFVQGAGAPPVIETSVADIIPMTDLFLRQRGGLIAPYRTITTSDKRQRTKSPAVPTTPVVVVNAGDTETKFDADTAGTYQYAVAAKNTYGESPLLLLTAGAGQAIAAGESVNLGWTAQNNSFPATGYIIYRSEPNPTDVTANTTKFYPIFEVSVAEYASGSYDNAGTNGQVRDRNRYIANTDQGFVAQYDQEVVSLAELLPMAKLPLGIVNLQYRTAVFSYCTPILYAPKKLVRFINIGRYVAP